MKSDNIKKLIDILKSTNDWISSDELASIINVDKRTIKNYVNEINRDGFNTIESSPKGYKLVTNSTISVKLHSLDYLRERSDTVLYSLLSAKEGISVFNLSEKLNVSESTIMNDITSKLKPLLNSYHLELTSHDYVLSLKGGEQDKRRLIGHIATRHSKDYFSSTKTLKDFSPDIDVERISYVLSDLCKQSGLSINSYAMNNLLIHLLVILIRLRTNNALTNNKYTIDNLLNNSAKKEQVIFFSNKIAEFFEFECNQKIPEDDFKQIVLLVSLSLDHSQEQEINIDEFTNFIDKNFFTSIVGILKETYKRYDLPDPDNDFLYRFALHIYNLYQRAIFQVDYPNPLAAQIKQDHAPVYDMAVYFSHQLAQLYNIKISENEIGFIAFHIGANLESQTKGKRITCLLIVEKYHSFMEKLLHELHVSFGEELTVAGIVPFSSYSPTNDHAELIISTTNYDFNHKHVVVVNPIITKNNIKAIYDEIIKIEEEKKLLQTISFLHYIFDEDLFLRNTYRNSVEEYIQMMGDLCLRKKIIDEAFIKDVLNRESFSSTAFTDYIAIPHSISYYANKSFICVLHNDKSIPWKKKNINFIFLIGIADGDMKYFRNVFDIIVESFSSLEKTRKFLKTDTFEEFMNILTPGLPK